MGVWQKKRRLGGVDNGELRLAGSGSVGGFGMGVGGDVAGAGAVVGAVVGAEPAGGAEPVAGAGPVVGGAGPAPAQVVVGHGTRGQWLPGCMVSPGRDLGRTGSYRRVGENVGIGVGGA